MHIKSACEGCWNELGSKDSCSRKCKRLDAWQRVENKCVASVSLPPFPPPPKSPPMYISSGINPDLKIIIIEPKRGKNGKLLCGIDDCGRPHHSRGMCKQCYYREWRKLRKHAAIQYNNFSITIDLRKGNAKDRRETFNDLAVIARHEVRSITVQALYFIQQGIALYKDSLAKNWGKSFREGDEI